MSDHAERDRHPRPDPGIGSDMALIRTIQSERDEARHSCDAMSVEVAALLAERQQARQEAEVWKESSRTWEARYNGEAVRLDKAERERQQAQRQIDTLSGRILNLETERRQAIDALREAHNRLLVIECDARYEDGNIEQAQKIEALLQKIGEKPQ